MRFATETTISKGLRKIVKQIEIQSENRILQIPISTITYKENSCEQKAVAYSN